MGPVRPGAWTGRFGRRDAPGRTRRASRPPFRPGFARIRGVEFLQDRLKTVHFGAPGGDRASPPRTLPQRSRPGARLGIRDATAFSGRETDRPAELAGTWGHEKGGWHV